MKLTSVTWTSPVSKILVMTSSSFEVPNSFSRVALLAVSMTPCAPCLNFREFISHYYSTDTNQIRDSLVGDEDLEAADDLGQWDGTVTNPLLHRLGIINEDNEVLLGTLVDDLGLGGVSTRHFD